MRARFRAPHEQQVDERVSNGHAAEQRCDDEHAAQRGLGEDVGGALAHLPPSHPLRRRLSIVPHQQDERDEAEQGRDDRCEEHDVVAPRVRREKHPRRDGPERGAHGVERAMDAEGGCQLVGRHAQRDQGIARRRADGLAEAIGDDERRDRAERAPGDQQPPQPAHCRQRISASGRQLASTGAIGHPAAEPGRHHRAAFVQACGDAERDWAAAAHEHEIGRQDAHDHLRRDVSQETGDPESPDSEPARAKRPPARTDGPGARDEGPNRPHTCQRARSIAR